MCLDIICPRWSLKLAHYTALMSWCINWPRVRDVHRIYCVLMCAEGVWGGREGWLENLCHIFPSLSAETSVSPEFGLGEEWGKNWNNLFIYTDRYVHALRDVILPRLRESINVLSSATVAYKALVLESRKENLKILHFYVILFSLFDLKP